MSPSYTFAHTDGYRAQEFRCPLLHPRPTAHTCTHEQFRKGPGCVKYINIERGGLMRVLLDRDSATYKDLYRQRTAAERINAQATALGIERPKGMRQNSERKGAVMCSSTSPSDVDHCFAASSAHASPQRSWNKWR
jgi:hypothetical protein